MHKGTNISKFGTSCWLIGVWIWQLQVSLPRFVENHPIFSLAYPCGAGGKVLREGMGQATGVHAKELGRRQFASRGSLTLNLKSELFLCTDRTQTFASFSWGEQSA